MKTEPQGLLLAVCLGVEYLRSAAGALLWQLSARGRPEGLRRAGAASLDLAYVAAGRYDAFWEFGLSEWDMAAGALLIQEAGGLVSDFSGSHEFLEKGQIVAGNTKCFKAVLTAIQPHLTPALKR